MDADTFRAWGRPRLITERHEVKYCDCGWCEGHETSVSLPKSEWYWRPSVIDMSLMPMLSDEPRALSTFLSELGKRGDGGR